MKNLFTYLGRMVCFTSIFLICSLSNAATYYFSSTLGDDARSSAQAQNQNTPWKSIQKLNSVFSTLQPGDNILFKNGDTFQGTLTITKSGTAGAPISFGSYGSGDKPVITSLVKVLNWTSKGGNVYEAPVGVANALNIVLLDGKAHAMGRFPNAEAIKKGYLTISSSTLGNISSSELQAPTNFTGGEVVIRKNNWIIDRHYINQHSGTSINYNTTGSNYNPKIGFGFFIQNHPGTLDQNGEWYFNKQNKTLQIYYDRGDPSSANIQVALNNQVIEVMQGISNISFSNLSILGANENLVSLSSSSNISFTSSELKFAGRNGINAVSTTNFSIQNSLVEDMFNSGLFFQWQDVNMKILNNTFNRTHVFAGMGRNGDMNGNTIYMSETSGNGLVENNKILNSGYQGINFNGNNTTIKNNLVDTFCFVKDDGAGIYTYTGSSNITLTNRKVINNIVINGIGAVDGTKPYGPNDFPYVEGIYMDDNSTGVEISGNTVANVASSGIYIHNSRSIDILQNNIYNVGNSILFVHDNLGDANRNINMKNNNFLAKTTKQAHIFVRSKLNDVAQMGTFDLNVYARPVNESNTITLKIPEKDGLIDLQTWKNNYGLDINSTKSPVAYDPNKMSIDEFILFDYNYSNTAKSLPLSGTYVDLKGKTLSGSVSVPAYSSVLLLKTGAGTPIANVPPTVSITAPAANAQFIQGENISITSVAADSDGTIAKVDFFNGNTLLGTDTTSPYSYAWGNLSLGTFSLTAKATDDKGMATVSAPVAINVVANPNMAPTVSITAPAANAQFIQGENISITSVAADSDGTIAKVDFFNGNTLLGTDTTSPYSYDWANLPPGSHSLTAKATDDKGTATVSAPVSINVSVKTSRSPYSGSAATIPGTVEAENYDFGEQGVTYFDVDAGNYGKVYRNEDVDIGAAAEGGYTVGWMNLSEWLEYTVNITSAGAYNFDARVASPGVGGTFHIECDGIDVTGPLTVPATGAWDVWTSVTKTGVNLPAGTHVLRYVLDSYGVNGYWGNLNSMHFTKQNAAPSVSITAPAANAQFVQGDNISITSVAADSDGTIAKVDFFNGTALLGTDTTSPYSVTWANLSVGTFSLTAKATDDKGTATVSAPVSINVSVKTSRSPYSGIATTIPGTVEAENYDFGGKGLTYNDVDAGNNGGIYRNEDVDISTAVEGGYTVGWMKLSEWLEYTVNITYEGAYNLDARVASPGAGGTFHIECDGIDVTGPLTVPATGGWNTWTSVTKTGVNLPAGTHVLRYVLDSYGVNGYWGNLNSMHFTKQNAAPTVSITAPAANAQFIQGDNISITSVAADSDGTIAKVDFFNGTALLGTDNTSPYSYPWANLPLGSHSLTAKATDDKGSSTISPVININVLEKATPGPGVGTGLLEGLVAFYEMNTNLSNILHDSHGQNHGTSNLISHVNGFNDKGNKYDGKSSISSVPHSNGLNLNTEFTLMADIFRQGNGQENRSIIIGKTFSASRPENQVYSMAITKDNKIRIRTNNPNLQDWFSTQTVPLGKWVRIIATYKSGEGYSLYFDTVQPENSPKFTGTIAKSDQELTIGSASLTKDAANYRRFEGVLDNVGIWNRKLSLEEITDLITNKITYPDFTGSEVYRVLMTTTVENIPGNTITTPTSTKAEAGQKLVFLVEKGDEKEGVVFDHWSIDGVRATNQTLFELEMPEKDITLTKHFRTFVAPEIKLSLPNQQSEFEASSKVNIGLQITSNDSEIMKVEIYNGESLMSELTPESTGFEWKDIPLGNHELMARITDANGETYYSDPVQLKAVDYQNKENHNVLLEYVIGPNPTTDYLNVIFKNLDGEYDFEFRIVSMNGSVQRAFIARPEESKVTIDVSDLVTGTYVLQLVANGKGISAKKFIKMQ